MNYVDWKNLEKKLINVKAILFTSIRIRLAPYLLIYSKIENKIQPTSVHTKYVNGWKRSK